MTTKPAPADIFRATLQQSAKSAPKPDPTPPPPVSRNPGRINRVQINTYFPEPTRRQLRQMALDHRTSVQALMKEAINDLFAKYAQPEIAE